MNEEPNETVWREELQVSGRAVIDTFKDLLHEGNVRRITIKNSEGKAVMSIPVTVGVLGVLVAPTVAAVGAIVAVGADYTIEVERRDSPPPSPLEEAGRAGTTSST
jgi:hypothetical protein